jgi:lipopolysaccharide transport protein LptA
MFLTAVYAFCEDEIAESLRTIAGEGGKMTAVAPEEHIDSLTDMEKTEITCDGPLEVDYEKNVAIFNENVLVKDPQVMLKANKMQVFFDAESKTIDRIVAEGSVKFKKGDRQAKSEMAVYLAKEGKIVLTGNPMVKRGMDALTGEKITFFKNDNRMICEPSAKLVIFSEERSEEEEGEWW